MSNQNAGNGFLKYGSLSLQLLITIAVAGWLGHLLDDYLDLKFPAFLLTFILFAFGAMMYRVFKSLNNE